MILKALYDLAVRENLDPFYEPKEVNYLIHLDRGGKFLRILEPLEEAWLGPKGRPKGKPRAPKRPVPRRSARTVQDAAEFLVDKAEYVFGVDPRKDEKRKKDPHRPETRRRLFRECLQTAFDSPHLAKNEGLRNVLAFLDQDVAARDRALSEWLSEKMAADPKALEAGLFAFVHVPDGGAICVHEHADIRSYWSGQLGSGADVIRGQCLVTGADNAPLSRLHAAPKGIPPVRLTKGGVPLTSVNQDSFRSYGLESIGCAPISAEATQRVDAALTRLLDPAYPGTDGSPMPRRCVYLTPNTVLVYWAREDAALDFVAGLDAADPEQVSALLHSPYKGRPAAIEDPSSFYALVLSGTQGRGIVRSFLESTVRDVAANVERYFADARITRPFSKLDGTYPILNLRRSLVFEGDLDRLPPDLAVQTYVSILRGRTYPRILLEAAVRRNRVDLFPKKGFLRGPEALAARCSLIKAFLVRNLRREVPVSLDAKRPEPAYRLGRLLAVVDKLQADALGSVNATIVDRYYGSASSTPAAVMPTLVRRCQHHLGKLRREKPGWAVNQEKLLQEVMGGLERFPPILTLEEQGLFALGFYHQRQAFYVKKEGAVE